MDRHLVRRLLVAASLTTLIGMGAAHPSNAVMRPGMVFAGFGALFMITTLSLAAYFEYGRPIVVSTWRFLMRSEAVILMAGIFVLALTLLGLVSWREMTFWQMIAFATAAVVGLLAAFREYLGGVADVPRLGQAH